MNTIFGSFSHLDDAERAVAALLDHGLKAEQLTIVSRDGESQSEMERDRKLRIEREANHSPDAMTNTPNVVMPMAVTYQGDRDETPRTDSEQVRHVAEHGITVTTMQDAGAGAAVGAGVGLGVGVLAALTAVAIPGIGIVLGGGALAVALAGAAATAGAGAIAGGAFGYLKDMGVTPDVVDRLNTSYADGHVIVGATWADEAQRTEIHNVFNKYRAQNVGAPDPTHWTVTPPVSV